MSEEKLAFIEFMGFQLPTLLTIVGLRKRWAWKIFWPYIIAMIVGSYWVMSQWLDLSTISGRGLTLLVPPMITAVIVWLCSWVRDDFTTYSVYQFWKSGVLRLIVGMTSMLSLLPLYELVRGIITH